MEEVHFEMATPLLYEGFQALTRIAKAEVHDDVVSDGFQHSGTRFGQA